MEQTKIKTILIDDEQIALDRMKVLLKNFPEIEVSEAVTNPRLGLEMVAEYQPDLAFIDVEMPELTGLEIAEELEKRMIYSRIIFVTSHDHYAIEALRTNAFDYILKPVSIKKLKAAIHRYVSKTTLNLSKREVVIIRLVAKGLRSQEIGEQLKISKHTVDTHRRKILDKTNCKNTVELMQFSSSNNIL